MAVLASERLRPNVTGLMIDSAVLSHTYTLTRIYSASLCAKALFEALGMYQRTQEKIPQPAETFAYSNSLLPSLIYGFT